MAKSKLRGLKKIKKSKKLCRGRSEIIPDLDPKIIQLIHSHPIWTSRGNY